MRADTKPVRTPGSIAVAFVVGLMLVTPGLAATTLHPLTFSWDALLAFVSLHQFELILGFALMIAIALLLKAAAAGPRLPRIDATPLGSMIRETAPRGLDGLA